MSGDGIIHSLIPHLGKTRLFLSHSQSPEDTQFREDHRIDRRPAKGFRRPSGPL